MSATYIIVDSELPSSRAPSLRNGHRMTLYSWANPRYFPALPRPVTRYFDVAPDARVVADCHWQAERWERPTLLVLHGLNGSSDAHYMKGIAAKAFARGMNVVRLNQRNCGGTEHLAAGLFHSGLTADAAHVLHELAHGRRPAGDRGRRLFARRQSRVEARRRIRSACAASARRRSPRCRRSSRSRQCTRALERPENVLYNWNFVKDLEAPDAAERTAAPGTLRSDEARRSANRARNSTRRSRRRTSGFAAPRTITIVRARCASSIASRCRRSSSRRRTIRSCRRSRSAIRKSPGIRTSSCTCARTAAIADSSGRDRRPTTGTGRNRRSCSSWNVTRTIPSVARSRHACSNRFCSTTAMASSLRRVRRVDSEGPARLARCLHGETESADQKTRREQAIKVAQAINSAEVKVVGPRSRPTAGPRSCRTCRRCRQGSRCSSTPTARTYTFSIKDTLDRCNYAIFSDQEKFVYEGTPLTGARILPLATPE